MNCKLTAQDAAHYCKKLEKVGFVDSESLANCSEKRISLRWRNYQKSRKQETNFSFNQLVKSINSEGPDKIECTLGKRQHTEEKGWTPDLPTKQNMHVFDALFE